MIINQELRLSCVVRLCDTFLCKDKDDKTEKGSGKKVFDEFHVCVFVRLYFRVKLLNINADELMELLTIRIKQFTK